MTSEETVKVRPSKIVAGHEAERTNEFLQALSSVVINKVGVSEINMMHMDTSYQVDCTDAIQRVLKGEKPEKERRKRFFVLL